MVLRALLAWHFPGSWPGLCPAGLHRVSTFSSRQSAETCPAVPGHGPFTKISCSHSSHLLHFPGRIQPFALLSWASVLPSSCGKLRTLPQLLPPQVDGSQTPSDSVLHVSSVTSLLPPPWHRSPSFPSPPQRCRFLSKKLLIPWWDLMVMSVLLFLLPEGLVRCY